MNILSSDDRVNRLGLPRLDLTLSQRIVWSGVCRFP